MGSLDLTESKLKIYDNRTKCNTWKNRYKTVEGVGTHSLVKSGETDNPVGKEIRAGYQNVGHLHPKRLEETRQQPIYQLQKGGNRRRPGTSDKILIQQSQQEYNAIEEKRPRRRRSQNHNQLGRLWLGFSKIWREFYCSLHHILASYFCENTVVPCSTLCDAIDHI